MCKPMFSASLAVVVCLVSQGAFALDSVRAERDRKALREFDSDPKTFMNAMPPKTMADGSSLPTSYSVFPKSTIQGREYVHLKASWKTSARSRAGFLFGAPYADNDRAQDLVDQMSVWTLEEMEAADLRSTTLGESPWSGSYWPLYEGELANRYADPAFPRSMNWKTNQAYIMGHLDDSTVGALSPAEKYDLLVGDANHGLTRSSLSAGEEYYTRAGHVESWMGICHGWSPAAYMEPRPIHSVTVPAADGVTQISFRPSDLKALGSLLWANGTFENRFIGTRCDVENPKTDVNGRILDPACFDENPATWHLAVVNQIGASRRSFIMDAAYDYQVWNQPIYSYTYSYFNPQTLQPSDSITGGTVAREAFTKDKFSTYRSEKAAYFVGISMDLTYVSETSPSTAASDTAAQDSRITVHYLYDLELDSDHQLLGGEWYRNAHPDFLWSAVKGTHAVANGDVGLTPDLGLLWDGRTLLPDSWLSVASASSNEGQPLAHVVEALLELAKGH